MTSIAIIASAAEDKIDTVKLKKELVEKAPKPTITDEKEKDEFAENVSKEFSELFAKVGYDQEEFDKFFTSKGYIKFDAKKANKFGIDSLLSLVSNKVEASQASNVQMSSPYIYYNTYTGRWIAVGGGYWTSDYYWDSATWPGIEVGGRDLAGIYFSNLMVNGTQVPITRQELHTRYKCSSLGLTSTTRYNQSSVNGVFFSFQDYRHNHISGCQYAPDYSCDGFSILLEFGPTFSSANGVASSGYEHTWSSTGISSMTIGSSGWSVTLSNGSDGWPASSTDTAY